MAVRVYWRGASDGWVVISGDGEGVADGGGECAGGCGQRVGARRVDLAAGKGDHTCDGVLGVIRAGEDGPTGWGEFWWRAREGSSARGQHLRVPGC